MFYENIQEGMEVKIVSISKTGMKFGTNSIMEKMIGKVFPVKRKLVSIEALDIGGWNWHAGDVMPIEENIEKIETETFNPQDLVL